MKTNLRLLAVLSCFLLVFSSCQKQSDNNSTPPSSEENVPLVGEKLIITDAISDTVSLYDYIPLNQVYGFCNGLRFSVNSKVTKPSGEIIDTNKQLYVDEEGVYNIVFTSVIGEETITETKQVNVNKYSIKPLFEYMNSSFVDDDAEISNNINYYSANHGAYFKLGGANSTIKYKNVIDLKEVEGNLIEISPNPYAPLPNLESFKVTLTDAYDTSRHISVLFKVNDAANYPSMWQHGSINTFAQVEFNGYSVANYELFPDIKTYTVLWDQGMWTSFSDDDSVVGTYVPVSFMYDYDEMIIKACGRIGQWATPNKWHVIYDLDDPDDNLRDFAGWTTGEVYITIEGNGSNGDLVVTKIGNDYLKSDDKELFKASNGELLTKGYDFDNLPNGAVNYYYPLADTSSSKSEVSKSLYKLGAGDEKELVENVDFNNFYPQEAGTYLIRYESINNFGYPISREGQFIVNQNPTDIIDLSSVSLEVKLFESHSIPTFNYGGGNGKLTKDIELVVGNSVQKYVEGDLFIIDKKESVNKLRVVVTDSINQQKTFEYNIQVNCNVIKFNLIDSFDSVSVIEGNDFIVPNYTAIDYSKDDISQTNIPVLIKQGKNKAYQPGDRITIEGNTSLTYSSGTEVLKTIVINSVPYELSSQNIDEQFINRSGVDSILTSMCGLVFTSNGDSKMEFVQPFPLGTTNLQFSLAFFPRMMNYNSINIDLFSLDSNYLHLELTELKSGKPYLYINGIKSSFNVEVTSETYDYNDVSAFKSQPFYTYSFYVDGAKKGILNSSGIKGDEIRTWANGSLFDKFSKACTLVKYSVDNPTQGDVISLYRVSNQLLTSVGLDYGDLAAPTLAFEQTMQSSSFNKDDNFMIPKAYAYDFFSDGYNIQMSILDSDGEKIVSKVAANQYPLTFNKYGSYSVTYNFKDARDNGGTLNYVLVSRDTTPPTIKLLGEYKKVYNGVFKIIDAFVKDNYDTNPKLSVTIGDANDKRTFVSPNQMVLLEKGTYKIVYYAFDSEGNSSRLVREIIVK